MVPPSTSRAGGSRGSRSPARHVRAPVPVVALMSDESQTPCSSLCVRRGGHWALAGGSRPAPCRCRPGDGMEGLVGVADEVRGEPEGIAPGRVTGGAGEGRALAFEREQMQSPAAVWAHAMARSYGPPSPKVDVASARFPDARGGRRPSLRSRRGNPGPAGARPRGALRGEAALRELGHDRVAVAAPGEGIGGGGAGEDAEESFHQRVP